MEKPILDYMLAQLQNLLGIDSTTGQHKAIEAYVFGEMRALGYTPERLVKGGVRATFGGAESPLLMTAHADDIGLIVRAVNADGTLRVKNVGGLYPFQCEQANVRVHARCGRVYTGTMRRANCSLHLMPQEERQALPDYDTNLVLFLDEDAVCPADVEKLGIRVGDLIALDPMTVFTESGYIKSRYLDDKASVAALLAFMKYVKEEGVTLARRVTVYVSLYEEVGHGGASGFPADVEEVLAVDIGCCGPANASSERKVSICAMDTFSPYHADVVDGLVRAAEQAGVPYALDLFVPHYGSDADAALKAGLDVRHGLIGPGVLGTHGYERTHVKGLAATFDLIRAYVR